MNWGHKISAHSIKQVVNGPYDVTGVLTFRDGERICHAKAIKLMAAFWHKVDRVFFGHAADKGYGINRLCFLEFGKSQKCIHLHFVAHSPVEPNAFCAILNVLWNTFHDETAELSKNWITPIYCKEAVAGYVTKETWRFRDDQNVLNCDHTNADSAAYGSFDIEALATRIANHVDQAALDQALAHIPVHMVLIRKRAEKRKQEAAAKQRERELRMRYSTTSFRQLTQSHPI